MFTVAPKCRRHRLRLGDSNVVRGEPSPVRASRLPAGADSGRPDRSRDDTRPHRCSVRTPHRRLDGARRRVHDYGGPRVLESRHDQRRARGDGSVLVHRRRAGTRGGGMTRVRSSRARSNVRRRKATRRGGRCTSRATTTPSPSFAAGVYSTSRAVRVTGYRCCAGARGSRRADACGKRVLVGAGRKLPFVEQSFDAVVSFETIEHFDHRDRFVAELARVLTDSGILILSTPNANHSQPVDGKPRNPFHVHEYTPEELSRELEKQFDSVHLMGQVLDSRFRVPPLNDEQRALAARGGRASVLAWRALAKLPGRMGNVGSQWLWRQPLFPSVTDYRFLESQVEAPILVALCKRNK